MANDKEQPVQVLFTPEFKRNLRKLAKKYRHIREDIKPVVEDITDGKRPGDQITGLQHEVFKVRVRNSDAARGKSGGYRLIYLAQPEAIVLITVYSKSDQADVAAADIRRIIRNHETTAPDETSTDDQE